MITILLAVHVVLCVLIILLVLMQNSKGSGMGASFGGGASNTVFGSRGNMSFLGKVTSVMVLLFFITSLLLAWVAQQQFRGEDTNLDNLIEGIEERVQQDDLPVLEQTPLPPATPTE